VVGVPEVFNAAGLFVDAHLREGRGGRTAFRFQGRGLTYAEVASAVDRVAHGLDALGVEIEQRVVLLLDDSPAFAAAFWAAVKLGAVAVPLDPQATAEELAFVLEDSRARAVIAEGHAAERVRAARARSPWLRHVLVAGGPAPAGTTGLDALPGRGPFAPVATSREDVVYWGYTSGSTGRPKAALHSHKDFVAAAELVGQGIFGLRPDDRVFSASKLFFAFGLGNTLYFPALVGAAAVLVPERIDAERAFEVITRERPTVFFTVPTLYARMLAVPDAGRRFDLGSLRYCVSSGEALPPALFDAWRARFGLELVEVVGSTEALHDFIANVPGAARRGSAGRVVPGFEARLVDDEGRPVPDGVVGHLLVKGETTSPGYWNRLEKTRATMRGEWLWTGDMFARDAEGWFTFAGRSDDMLKVAGRWVSPAEVEGHLAAHPAVLEAGVVGCADAQGLIRPHAFVALRDGAEAGDRLAGELIAFVRARAPRHQAPAAVHFVAELPRTATGKVQRFRLRALAAGAA
jgi:benzoate-CoA ligase family protein